MARLMDPIDTTIDAVGTIAASYRTVNKITDLPQAFKDVEKSLPLVLTILERAKLVIDDGRGGAETILLKCMERAKQLSLIYYDLQTRIQRDSDATSWANARSIYRNAVGGTSTNLVEILMLGILSDVQNLVSCTPWEITSKKTIQDLAAAIQQLSGVEPSLKDAYLNNGGVHNQQNNRDHASWLSDVRDGRYSSNHVTGNIYTIGENNNLYFGTKGDLEECRSD